MDSKKVIVGLIFLMSTVFAAVGQTHSPDSVVQQVFKALTGDEQPLPANVDSLLYGPEWEALAYWDVTTEKQLESMHEAVGDIYQVQKKNFVIKLVNPNNPKTYLNAITGTYLRQDNTLTLLSPSGKKLLITIVFLDGNYLVTEMDGLRIFFTKTRSYQAN